MTTILFSKTVLFPTGALQEALSRAMPALRWQVGEEVCDSPRAVAQWRDHQIISGRAGGDMIFCELHPRDTALPDEAPRHRWHLEIGRPTTEDEALAHRLVMLVCAIVMALDDDSLCRLLPDGGWLNGEELDRATRALLAGEPFETIARLGRPSVPRRDPAAPLQPSPDGTRPMPDDAPTDVSLSGRDIGDFDQVFGPPLSHSGEDAPMPQDACERASEAVADLGRAVPASSGPTVEEGFRRALIAGRSAPAIRAQARQEGAPPSPAPAPFRRTVMGFGRKGL